MEGKQCPKMSESFKSTQNYNPEDTTLGGSYKFILIS